ncbi:MAG: DUF99 family protein [Pseudomonadota bacterium]|nr:MAG: DUF99 domain-containing protein [Pseudomonadota bacterium]
MNVIGFDDGPFARTHRGSVLLVGAVCADTRLDGVVSGRVRRDGTDSTERMIELVTTSQFREHVRAVMLQGIAVGGFNVVDVHALSAALGVPVLVVMRRRPDFSTIRRALFASEDPPRPRIRGAERKWRLIEAAGPVELLELPDDEHTRSRPSGLRGAAQRVWIQRIGLTTSEARALIRATTLHGHIPEPLRLAHLIAGGIAGGVSRGRA